MKICCCFGRNGHQEEDNAGRGPPEITNVKNFENAPTLPSCWSPPQQYNESSSNKSDKSSIYQDTPRPSSSSSSNEEGKRSSSKGERIIEGKTFIITDISKDSRVINAEKKNIVASQTNVAGVFRKESDHEKGSLSGSLPQEVERRGKDHHLDEENLAKPNVVFRQRTDFSRDKEMRLKDWEKRLSQREGGFYGAHEVTGEKHSSKDPFVPKSEGKHAPDPNYADKKDVIKTFKDSRESYHEDYLHKTYKAMEKDARHTERFEKEGEVKSHSVFSEDNRERRRSLQIEREKLLREGTCDRNYEKQAQYSRKEHNESFDSFQGKRNIVDALGQLEKLEQKERSILEDDKREKPRRDEKERWMKEDEERKRLRSKRDEESERLNKQKLEHERSKKDENEGEKVRRQKNDRERMRRESGDKERVGFERGRERVKAEDGDDSLRREEKDREKLRREKEEWRHRREMEEKERMSREDREQEKLRKGEEEREKQLKEMRELEKLKREEEERAKLKRKEKERMRREEEEQERMKREEEEKMRLMREVEMERIKKEGEERERVRREKEEKEKLKREEEIMRKEKEERMRKELEERLRREEEEKLRKEEEEKRKREKEEKRRKEEELRKNEEERRLREDEEKRRKEIERRKIEEEEERLRREEEEKLKREEDERLKREEDERLRREEEERLRREEEERLRREKEERLRRQEKERLRKEEEERLRREEEEERLKREAIERLRMEEEERLRMEEKESLRRKEEEERLRIEEEQRLRKEEEEERLRMEEEEKLRREEEDRLRREEEERFKREEEKRLRMEEEMRLRKEEEERLEREEEERLRRKQQEKLRKEEEERLKKKKEELQKRKEEEKEKIRKEEEMLQKQKLDKEKEEREMKASLGSSNIEENKLSLELERKWQEKREKLEEEERLRREKDRLEIEKTKKRIAELKKERDEIQRQQAIRLRMLMKQENGEDQDNNEIPLGYTKVGEDETSGENSDENFSPNKVISAASSESENIENENTDSTNSNASKMKKTEAIQINTFYEEKSTSSSTIPDENGSEEITYDHTVKSAQHKLEFCTGSYNESVSKDAQNSATSHFNDFPSSTLSSNFEPLPPPVPPHSIDPAILTANHIIEQTPLPPLPPQPMLDVCSELPEPMTPEEAEKLLSHNIIETKKSLITEALEADSAKDLTTSEVINVKSDVGEDSLVRSKEEEDDGFDKDYDSVCVDSPTPDNEEDLDDSFGGFKHEVNGEGFVVRAKEVLSEDGVHYLEDGHFWIQVPGLMEEDEDDIPDTVPFHKHTKLKFSQDPIKLYSTFSVMDYDRRNDEVDPVAASAEYELEKRVEKMNVFPVSIDKGDGGLGLSIIGMGVGADAGVEKLGIFVKTITPGGATDRDGRIRVNDQIIEVDNQSLVGVTQMFAASVLKNTSGTVNFLIGRESDPENSEVAMLIRQSLMADQERDDRRRALEGPNYDSRDCSGPYESFSSQSGGESPSEDGPRGSNFVQDLHREPNIYGQEYGDQFGDVYNSRQSSSPRGTSSPPPEAFNHDVEGRELLLQNNEMMIMSQHLQEIQHRNEMYEEEINILRNKICELERELGNVNEMTKQIQEANSKLDFAEDTLKSKQAEIATYQDMLEQSQGQYIILEKKYYKAKKIIKEYQSRERDFLHREEYHITQLEEKDALYNSLVKALKDRVIQLEGDLIKAQQEAGLPVKVPPDLNTQSSNFVYSSKGPDNHSSLQRDPPRKPATLINCLDPDLSDTEAGDTHTSEGSKSSTVERKIPSKEELDVAVPPTELLDNSFSKAKGELASRGGLANRQLPSLKKSASNASSNSFDNSLDDGLNDAANESQQQIQVTSPSKISKSTVSSVSQNESVLNTPHSPASAPSFTANSQSSMQENIHSNSSRSHPPPPYHMTNSQTSVHPPSPHHQPPPYQPPPSAPLSHRPVVASDSHSGRSDGSYRHPPPIARVQPVNRVEALPSPTSPLSQQQQQQQTLANQLKAILAEREGNNEVSQESNREGSPMKKSPSSLMEDVRRAVMQADISIGKKPVISGPIHVSSTAQVVSTGQFVHSRTSPQKGIATALPQKVSRDSGTWSPIINTGSPAGGVVLLSQRPIDSSLPLSKSNEMGAGLENKSGMTSSDSNASFDAHQQHHDRVLSTRSSSSSSIMSVFDWSKEQVAQWLVLQGLENYVSTFVNAGITGPRLINIDTKDLKNLGLSSDDKNRIKRKVKELRQNLEKERKQIEKENKEREKLQKKAEKLAEKAEKRKK